MVSMPLRTTSISATPLRYTDSSDLTLEETDDRLSPETSAQRPARTLGLKLLEEELVRNSLTLVISSVEAVTKF